MQEKTLLRASLIITIIGVSILFLISQELQINEQVISTDSIGKDIKVTGLVTRITDLDKVMFIELSKPEKTTAIIFKNRINTIDIEVGDKISVEGEVEEYKGDLELIVNKINRR